MKISLNRGLLAAAIVAVAAAVAAIPQTAGAAKGTISEEPAKAPAKAKTRRRLEPISNLSQSEPELAEPQAATAPPRVRAYRRSVPGGRDSAVCEPDREALS